MIKHAIDLLIIFLAKDFLSHDVTSGIVISHAIKSINL